VIVYVVVTAGFTSVDPLKATDPIPLSMLALSAPLVLQLSTEVNPTPIDKGSAVILQVGRVFTVMVILSDTDPKVLVAVTV